MNWKTKKLSIEEGKKLGISDFPNFSTTGSIRGMKTLYYGKDALLVRCGGYIYYLGNFDSIPNSDLLPRGATIYFIHAH